MDATTTRCQPLSGKGGGALWFGSGLEGFVQQGAPIPSKERRNMGTKAEPRYRDVDILTFRWTIVRTPPAARNAEGRSTGTAHPFMRLHQQIRRDRLFIDPDSAMTPAKIFRASAGSIGSAALPSIAALRICHIVLAAICIVIE